MNNVLMTALNHNYINQILIISLFLSSFAPNFKLVVKTFLSQLSSCLFDSSTNTNFHHQRTHTHTHTFNTVYMNCIKPTLTSVWSWCWRKLKTFSRIKKVKQEEMVTDGYGRSNMDVWLWRRMHVLSIKWNSWIYDWDFKKHWILFWWERILVTMMCRIFDLDFWLWFLRKISSSFVLLLWFSMFSSYYGFYNIKTLHNTMVGYLIIH